MLPNGFSADLRQMMLGLLWRQWGQLGLASALVEARDDWVIDPEALLLLTCTAGRWDPRLFDEAIDWTAKNCRFINIPRLKSLLRRHDFRGAASCGAMANVVLASNSRLFWRFPAPANPPKLEPLFFDPRGRPMGGFGPTDPIFLKFGYERGPVTLRGMSRQFNAVMPECTWLRLRAMFGISARAEVVLYLATHKIAHPSGIARDTGFSQKNIQDTLVDMAASGIVHSAALEGRMKSYFLREKDRAPFLYQPDKPPRWITWAPLFNALEELFLAVHDLDRQEMNSRLVSSKLRQLMKSVQPRIERAGFGGCLSDAGAFPGEAYTDIFMDDIRRLLMELHCEPSPVTGGEGDRSG